MAMNPRRTGPFGLVVSLLGHGLLLLGLALPHVLPRPRLPIEMEILPPKKSAVPPLGPQAAAPATPPGPESTPSPHLRHRQKRPAKPVGKEPLASQGKPPPGDPGAAESLGAVASDDASVAVLLRMGALRTSVHRPAIQALLDAFPDARILAAGTAFSPSRALSSFLLDDLQALLITTADVRRLSATVLVAVHDPGLDLRKKFAGREGPAPGIYDPRQLTQLKPGLTAYAREDLLKGWLLDEEGGVNAVWLARLSGLAAAPLPAVVAELRHLDRVVRLLGMPTPTLLVLSLSAEENPSVLLHLEFASPDDATRLSGEWPRLKEQAMGQLSWLGLSGLLGGLRLFLSGTTVEVRGALPGAEVDRLLSYLVALLPANDTPITTPRVKTFPGPPMSLPDAGHPDADAGHPDAAIW